MSDITRIRRSETKGAISRDQVEGLLRGAVNHVEANRGLVTNCLVVSVDHAVRAGTHPKTSGRVGCVVEVVVDDDASAVRTRRDQHAVLDSEIRICNNITVVGRRRL